MGIFWNVVLVKAALNESVLTKELVYYDRGNNEHGEW